MDAGLIGRACVLLGAGRTKASDAVDFAVGCSGIRKVGEQVSTGEPLLQVHARTDAALQDALRLINEAAVVE